MKYLSVICNDEMKAAQKAEAYSAINDSRRQTD